ncbi:MAG: hypothetical protein IJB01_03160 [Bacteroidaceae bacterium]|nr:hypothetical protein [Bacteroidaceae bacterium]
MTNTMIVLRDFVILIEFVILSNAKDLFHNRNDKYHHFRCFASLQHDKSNDYSIAALSS